MTKIFTRSGEIPHSKFSGRPASPWMDPDSEANYRYRPHPEYSAESISYRFNSYGYRCGEFSERREINVVSIGCSYTFGLGLPVHETFPELICGEISKRFDRSVSNWNLGLPGHSNDFISRTLLAALPELRPDFVLIMFTEFSRREYITADERRINVFPHMRGKPATRMDRAVLKYHRKLWTSGQDQENFYKNYQLAALLLDGAGIDWMFTMTGLEEVGPMLPLLDRGRFLGCSLEKVDLARDHLHPGRESQRRFVACASIPVCERIEATLLERAARSS